MKIIVCILYCNFDLSGIQLFPKSSSKTVLPAFDEIGVTLPLEDITKVIRELPFANFTLTNPNWLISVFFYRLYCSKYNIWKIPSVRL